MNFYLIGITSKQSLMVQILPAWAEALGVEVDLLNIDLPHDANALQYQKAVIDIKGDDNAIGSVVTAHKLKMYEYGYSFFDQCDALSEVTKEIGTIIKRGSHLIGMAMPDCMATALSLKSMLGDDYWYRNNSDVLCFGAGGVARAIVLSLLFDIASSPPLGRKQKHKPGRLLLVDINLERLEATKEFLMPYSKDVEIQYICSNKSENNDQLVSNLPIGSLVVNATGMGKDLPGSPLSDKVIFAQKAIIWDLNYRGERMFLEQAKSQQDDRNLFVYDGWLCFMHGWTQALQFALRETFSLHQFEKLVQIAESFRAGV